MINRELAKERGLSEETIAQIQKLQDKRDEIEKEMAYCWDFAEEKAKILDIFDQWKINEFALQVLWGFEPNANYHRDFNLPYCTCPKLDNEDVLGTSIRYVTEGCVYHDQRKKD